VNDCDKQFANKMPFTDSKLAVPIILFLCFIFFISYFFYNSIGIDHDIKTETGIIEEYYRLRFPGDGSIWVGGGYFYMRNEKQKYDYIDLAGEFFATPQRRLPKSIWNHFGIWREVIIDRKYGTGENWVAIPIWLILLITIVVCKFKPYKSA
jgi:hypothetical protein